MAPLAAPGFDDMTPGDGLPPGRFSSQRPNCYYEAGYAQALHKEMILTNYMGSPIAFSLHNHQFIVWNTEEELKKKLEERFRRLSSSQKATGAHGP